MKAQALARHQIRQCLHLGPPSLQKTVRYKFSFVKPLSLWYFFLIAAQVAPNTQHTFFLFGCMCEIELITIFVFVGCRLAATWWTEISLCEMLIASQLSIIKNKFSSTKLRQRLSYFYSLHKNHIRKPLSHGKGIKTVQPKTIGKILERYVSQSINW